MAATRTPDISTTDVQVDYHRNGITGEPFWIVHFTDKLEGRMMAVVFAPEGFDPDGPSFPRTWSHNPRVAVFNAERLPDTTFGANSYRGDEYRDFVYGAIEDRERQP